MPFSQHFRFSPLMAFVRTAFGCCVYSFGIFYTFDPSLFATEDEEDRMKKRDTNRDRQEFWRRCWSHPPPPCHAQICTFKVTAQFNPAHEMGPKLASQINEMSVDNSAIPQGNCLLKRGHSLSVGNHIGNNSPRAKVALPTLTVKVHEKSIHRMNIHCLMPSLLHNYG